MPDGLTTAQIEFIDTYIRVPKYIGRKKAIKRREVANAEFRKFNVRRAAVEDRILKLDDAATRAELLAGLDRAEEIIEANPKKLDFDGGLEQLGKVNATAWIRLQQQQAQEKFDILRDRLETVRSELGSDGTGEMALDNQDDVDLVWGFAQEKFDSGMSSDSVKDLTSAVNALDRLDALLNAATAVNRFELRAEVLKEIRENAEDGLEEAVLAARRELIETDYALAQLRDRATRAFGAATIPADIAALLDRAEARLGDARDADATGLAAAAAAARTAYDAALAAADRKIGEKTDWTMEERRFLRVWDMLTGHAHKDEATYVKPKFDAIAAAYADTQDKADTGDFAGAKTDLSPLIPRATALLGIADDYGRYLQIEAQRQDMLDGLPDPAHYNTVAELKTAIEAALALMTDAQAARNAEDMAGAVAALDRIPAAVAVCDRLLQALRDYNSVTRRVDDKLTAYATMDAAVTDQVRDEINLLRTARAEARQTARGGDLKEASHKLQALDNFIAALDKKLKRIADFTAEFPLFETRRRETRARRGAGGRIAIEDYYQRLKEDKARITNATTGADKDFSLALAAATAMKSKHAGMMALADVARDYLALRKDITDEITRLQGGAPGGAKATEAIAITNLTLADAQAATQANDWAGALRLLRSAKLELDFGTYAADMSNYIDGLQDVTKLDGIAGNFDAALAEFTKVEQAVVGLDTDSAFTARLQQARRTAESGRALLAATPPDPAGARAKVEEGIAACKEVAMLLARRTRCLDQIDTVKQDDLTLKGQNKDKSLDPELAEIKTRLRNAEHLADPKRGDYEGALSELAEADKQIGIAIQVRDVYQTLYKPRRDDIKYVLKELRKKEIAPGMGDEIARLDRLLTDLDAALTARQISRVKTLAREADGLLRPYLDQGQYYKTTAKAFNDTFVKPKAKDLDHPAIPGQIAELRAAIAGIEALMDQHAYRAALTQIYSTAYLIDRVRKAIADHPAYEAARAAAETAIQDLLDRDDPAVGPAHDRIAALKARYDAALDDAGIDQFAGALRKLQGFPDTCEEVAQEIDRYELCLDARDAALVALAAVTRRDTAAIAPLLTRLEGKRDNALARAAAFDFYTATALFEELLSDCATAEAVLDRQAEFGTVLETIGEIDDGDADGLKMSIKAAETTLNRLRGQPSSLYVKDLLDAARGLLNEARDSADTDFGTARDKLREMVDHCRDIATEMGQFDQLCDAAEVGRTLAVALEYHAQYAVRRDDVAAELARIDTAMADARRDRGRRAAASTAIETAIAALRALRTALDKHAIYVAERDQIRFELNSKLEKNRDRHLIKPEIAAAQAALDEAETQAAAADYPAATAELKKARTQIPAGLLRLKLAANQEPAPEDIRAFLGDPDSTKVLDKVINTLEPDSQRKVVAVAFKERFGCDLKLSNAQWVADGSGGYKKEITDDTDYNRAAPNLRRFYALMAELPDSATLDNDSFLSFSHRGGVQDGSYFNFVKKIVAMHEGEVKTSSIYAVGQEAELGPQDALYQTEPGEPVSYFNWNTLHEVAHAVDDKMGFMRQHLGEDTDGFGGWRHYRSDVRPVAQAVAGKFDFDQTYVADYIAGGKGSTPPVPTPNGCDAEEWDRRRRACEIWVDRARSKNSPWQTKVAADACTIGDRVYHESDDGDWVSYLASARAKGVTGYQFRAPAEWFSELYAAYHSGKLKNNHPAAAWLEHL